MICHSFQNYIILINLALILFLYLSFIFFSHSHLFSSISPMIELTKLFGLVFFPSLVLSPSFILIKTKLNLFFLIIFQLCLQLYSKLFLIFFLQLNPWLVKVNYLSNFAPTIFFLPFFFIIFYFFLLFLYFFLALT